MAYEKLRVGSKIVEKETGNEYEIELVGDAGQEGYSYELYPTFAKEIHSCQIGLEETYPFAVVKIDRA
ncbi:MAG: hypothetical protein WCI55_10335 [Armatimonadota bacterium]